MAVKKGGLGRGLDSLFSENAADERNGTTLKLYEIEPNRNQPRKDFSEEALSALADSISTHGLLQPIVVRPTTSGIYEIIAGERRWRACRMAGLNEVPVVIKDVSGQNAAEIALVENLQRENLNAFEEAAGYNALMEGYGLTQEEVSARVGKSRAAVANAVRLLKLPDEMLASLRKGEISAGQARTLLSAKSAERQKAMFVAAKNGASVRELEIMAKKSDEPKIKSQKTLSPYQREVELALKNVLRRKVTVTPKGTKGKGVITIEFYSDDDLKKIAQNFSEE